MNEKTSKKYVCSGALKRGSTYNAYFDEPGKCPTCEKKLVPNPNYIQPESSLKIELTLKGGEKTMKGTTGSTFTVVSNGAVADIGYREIGSNQYRVRVEPKGGAKLNLSDWTQPSKEQNRYSKVVSDTTSLLRAVLEAKSAAQKAYVEA